ncbi:gamma-glutamylcyclotransferase family protein [Curtobacterium flaccumfaciens]|uniref:gamma-glutamylcyclotransferase family protein n=1 Tax=Curtobacterium flaccumfaciens TaxID=2035 RepID=UPI0024A7D849|nr:gamma-glutamylcyclotransferase family protein [Curtobacterium flaccumfaciens]
MKRLSPGQRWVIGLGAFALVCLVVGVIGLVVGVTNRYGCLSDSEVWPQSRCLGDDSGIYWGSALGIIGLLHLGLTGLAGALVWTSTPAIAPRPVKRPTPRPGETHRVFSYGTLQQPLVQESLFGDHVPTTPDSLPGWRLDWVTITDPDVIRTSGSDRHPILRRGSAGDVVEGVALTLGYEWQLRAVDGYEVADYQRIRVTLASGSTAWVYVAADEA